MHLGALRLALRHCDSALRPSRPRPFPGGIDSAHAKDPSAERHRRAVERQRSRARLARPDRRRQPGLRRERVLAGRAAPPAAQARLQGAAAHARARRGAGHLARRRGRAGDEGVGDGEGRDPLHALVPAADRLDRGEARLLLRPGRRRHGDRRVLRQGADPGRARRLVVPDRRHPRDVRGARLHRLGPDLARRSSWRTRTARCCASRRRSRRGRARRSTTRSRCCARWTRSRARRSRALELLGVEDAAARVHDDRLRAGVLPDRRAVLLRAPRPA